MHPASIASFSLAPGVASGATVTRKGKLFEVGSWPPAPNRPAGFSLSAAEADAVAGATVPIEIEHVRSRLDGKIGTATFTGRSGTDLNGYLTLPKALNDLLGPNEPLAVSVVWDTATKKPLHVGIVLNPAITDAQVEAAFSGRATNAIDPAAIYAARNGAQASFSRAGLDAASIYAARRLAGRP